MGFFSNILTQAPTPCREVTRRQERNWRCWGRTLRGSTGRGLPREERATRSDLSCRVLWGRSGPAGSRLVRLASSILPGRGARGDELVSCFRPIGESPGSSLLLLLSCLRFKTSLSQGAGSEAAAVLPYGKRLWGHSSERPAAQRRPSTHVASLSPGRRPLGAAVTASPSCSPSPRPRNRPSLGFHVASFQEHYVKMGMQSRVLGSAPPTCTQSPQATSVPASVFPVWGTRGTTRPRRIIWIVSSVWLLEIRLSGTRMYRIWREYLFSFPWAE